MKTRDSEDVVASDGGGRTHPDARATGTPADLDWVDPASWRLRPLYADFFGLTSAPFDLTPNPRFIFLSERQREALGNLRYALAAPRGFSLILGEAGTGKTTLIRAVLAGLGDTASKYVLINNPTLGRAEFYEFLAAAFELSQEARSSKVRFLAELQRDIEERFARGGITGLVVDEAQSMPHELLEEIRLLGNIEAASSKVLNIVLCGQPELADRLNSMSLRQLKQRIALRCELSPLTLAEAASYISGRLRIAGGAPAAIFTREAVLAIFTASRGIPRTINVLCDNTLISGFAAGVKPVPVEIADEVCRDFDMGGPDRVRRADAAAVTAVAPQGLSDRSPSPPEPSESDVSVPGSAHMQKRRLSFFN